MLNICYSLKPLTKGGTQLPLAFSSFAPALSHFHVLPGCFRAQCSLGLSTVFQPPDSLGDNTELQSHLPHEHFLDLGHLPVPG